MESFFKTSHLTACFVTQGQKLDGVGPVDKRPSTDLLHQFVKKIKKKKEEEKKSCDM